MSETRRGAVVLLQAGDPEIAGALAAGVMEGRAAQRRDDLSGPCRATSHDAGETRTGAGRLTEEQRRVVEAEIDRQAIEEYIHQTAVDRALLRVAVGNHKTADDYAMMRFEAEVEYGEPVDYPSPLRRAANAALAIYAMFVEAVATAYRAQDKVLGG